MILAVERLLPTARGYASNLRRSRSRTSVRAQAGVAKFLPRRGRCPKGRPESYAIIRHVGASGHSSGFAHAAARPGSHPGGGDDGHVHDGRRKHDRGDSHADGRCRPPRLPSFQLGVRRLPADAGGDRADLWPARRSLRAQARVLRRRRATRRLHHRRRHLHADRARAGPGLPVQRLWRGGDRRPVARRLPGRACKLVDRVLGEPSHRRDRHRHDRRLPPRAAAHASAPDRLSRGGAVDGGRRRADDGAVAGPQPQPAGPGLVRPLRRDSTSASPPAAS